MARSGARWSAWRVVLVASAFTSSVLGGSVLKTVGYNYCSPSDSEKGIKVNQMSIAYENDDATLSFDVGGESDSEQTIQANLVISAYGNEVYNKAIDPCQQGIKALCPLPKGKFSAKSSIKIDSKYAGMIPSIAFDVPDISAEATLKLTSKKTGAEITCLDASVTNGKTLDIPAVAYLSVGVVGTSLVVSGMSAAFSGGHAGAGTGAPSPSFAETLGFFQGMAMNGMMSVNYPPVYRKFTKNFGFSTGIIPWADLQRSIDTFRSKTGGSLKDDSYSVVHDSSTNDTALRIKRALEPYAHLAQRDQSIQQLTHSGLTLSGISAYAEQLSVPKANTFMTVLLIVAIVVAAIVVCLLLVKVILEGWALFGNFPKGLRGFRKHYWGSIARTITSLILLLYGIWVLYCLFQFTLGDSWAAKTLAGVTLALFTGILAFFSWKIWSTVRKLKEAGSDASGLYQKKDIWIKYSLFYDAYKKDYWWLFVPTIVYLFAKGCTLAVGDGHGLGQSIAQLVVEALMLCLLVWSKPFERKSGNVINIAIQTVRLLSVVCILVFVDEFAVKQTTKTVAGVALIAVQSALTGILVILIIWNGIVITFKDNPHRKRRKEMEKLQRERDLDDLTPLDARNSLLLDRPKGGAEISMLPMSGNLKEKDSRKSMSSDHYSIAEEGLHPTVLSTSPPHQRPLTPYDGHEASQNLISAAAPIGYDSHRNHSPPRGGGYGAGGYHKQDDSFGGYYGGGGGGYRGY